jgi:hypothetical protein
LGAAGAAGSGGRGFGRSTVGDGDGRSAAGFWRAARLA